jgi:leader peptidase (prepilin peptidase)/N-methyltransferase
MAAFEAVFPYIALVFGLCLGSFYNVCIHRGGTGESIVHPPSKCPKCSHRLSWWENIPVVSWLLLRGRCRSCGLGISLRYPLIELLSGGLAFVLASLFGFGLVFFLLLAACGFSIVAAFRKASRL